MQASNPHQPRGSFSRPPEPKAAPKPVDEPSSDVTSDKGPLGEEVPLIDQQEERQKQISKFREEIERDLSFKLDDQDIKTYLFKGRLSKELVLVPDLLMGVLQTLKASDLQEIDTRMAQIKDKGQFTANGLENENAIVTLSYAWTHVDGKSLGDTPAIREERIRQMGALFLERAAAARLNFDTLVRLMLQEKNVLKK